MKLYYKISKSNETLNSILQNELQISSRLLFKLIRDNRILINNCEFDTRTYPIIGDVLTIDFNYDENNSNIVPSKMELDIVYEDDWLLIVNKPSGIPVHPSSQHFMDSLSNGVKFYFDTISLNKKIRPVNRLDLNTSGLVIFAKCEFIQECLISQMKSNMFKKQYLALCSGFIENKIATINLPIARKENSIIERCISLDGQMSITHYEVLNYYKDYCLVKCELETGRTHQIRVHMLNIGHPLIGDTLYGESSDLINRQALHCYKLSFIHPIEKNKLEIVGNLPLDFKKLIE